MSPVQFIGAGEPSQLLPLKFATGPLCDNGLVRKQRHVQRPRQTHTRARAIEGSAAPPVGTTSKLNPILEASALWRRGAGPALFILGSTSIIIHWFWVGVGVSYFGWVWCVAEWTVDSFALTKPPWVQSAGFAVLLAIFDVFSIKVVAIRAPIEQISYYQQIHRAGAIIEGIAWHPHLRDLRVGVSNRSDENYTKLDSLIRPISDHPQPGTTYSLVYDAKIVGEAYGCHLQRNAGNALGWSRSSRPGPVTLGFTPVGDSVDFYDSSGDPVTPLASDGGFRLQCEVLPPGPGVVVMLAVVSLPPKDLLPVPPATKEWHLAASNIRGAAEALDVLGDAPDVSFVHVYTTYMRAYKPFYENRVLTVRKQ